MLAVDWRARCRADSRGPEGKPASRLIHGLYAGGVAVKLLRVCLGVILFFGVFSGPALGAGPVDLSWRLKPGTQYHYRVSAAYQLTEPGNQLAVQISFGLGMEVLEVNSGGDMLAKLTLHSLLMRVSAPGGQILDFDSTAPWQISNASNLILAALPGLNYTVRCSPNGQVLETKGLDEYIRQIDQKLPDLPEKKSLLKNVQSRLSFVALMGLAAKADFFPLGPVAAGDSWHGTSNWDYLGMSLVSEDTFQLAQLDEEGALVQAEAVLRPVTAGDQQFSGRQRGEIRINPATGWPVRLRLEQEFTATGVQDGKQVSMQGQLMLEPLN